MTTQKLAHAILSDDKLRYSIAQLNGSFQLYTVGFSGMLNVVQILELALQHNLSTIWVAPTANINFFTAVHAVDSSGEWDIQYSTQWQGKGVTETLKTVTARRKTGTWNERRQIVITWPRWTAWKWDNMLEALNPVTCLGSIHYTEKALKAPMTHNPGVTGRNIIAETNSQHSRPEWIKPPVFDLKKLPTDLGYDMAYNRGIEPTDALASWAWLVALDKRSAYLGACSSVELGTGEPVYIESFERPGTLEKYYNGKRPGYWRIAYAPEDAPRYTPLYEGQEWVTTSLLKCLWSIGMKFEVKEAYVWLEHHRVLDKFATRLFNARLALRNNTLNLPNKDALALAEYNCKRAATAGVGILGNEQASKYCPELFHPDWQKEIQEESACRTYYQIQKVELKLGLAPLLVFNDMVVYVCTAPDPERVFGGLFDLTDRLGGWKVAYSMPFDRAVSECFKTGYSAGTCVTLLKNLVKGKIGYAKQAI